MRAKQRGMTLIELVVVMLVVSILASVAISSYRRTVIRANRVDGTSALLRVAAAQEKLYIVNNTYASTALLPAGLTTSDRGYYTLTVAPDASGFLTQGFVLTATPVAGGPQAADAGCTTLTLDNTGTRGSSGTALLADCWK